jgi:hypothetical protein
MYFDNGFPLYKCAYSSIDVHINIDISYKYDIECLYSNLNKNIDNNSNIITTEIKTEIETTFLQYSVNNYNNDKIHNNHYGGLGIFDILYFKDNTNELLEFNLTANNGMDYIIFDNFIKINFYSYVFYIIPFSPKLKNITNLKKIFKNDIGDIFINFSGIESLFKIKYIGNDSDFTLIKVCINKLMIIDGICGYIYCI